MSNQKKKKINKSLKKVKTVKYEKISGKNEDNSKSKKKFRIYFNFQIKIIFWSLLLILSICLAIILIRKSYSFTEAKVFNYKENSKISYKVFLHENDFYESPFLEENMSYIASLIKNVDLNYNYSFDIDEAINGKVTYDIVAKLLIADETGSGIYFQKDYVLLEESTEKINGVGQYKLSKDISIDYDYYNSLANRFKNDFGVNTVSNLIVSLNIKNVSGIIETKNYTMDPTNMSVTIPLSERAIDIKLQKKDINEHNWIIAEKDMSLQDITKLVLGVIFTLLACRAAVKVLFLLNSLAIKKSNYEKFINKTLKEYDRLIVKTSSMPISDDYTYIKIENFDELLDVRDNLKLPIMYYVVTQKVKSNFYIKNNNDIYLYVVKAVDLEDK